MKSFTRGHLYIIGIIVLVWILMESVFYGIAKDGQNEYEKNLIEQANYYYKDIEGKWKWNLDVDGIYVLKDNIGKTPFAKEKIIETEIGEMKRLSPTSMVHLFSQHTHKQFLKYAVISNNPVDEINKADKFYAEALKSFEKSKSNEAIYEIDSATQKLYYVKPLYLTKQCMECHKRKEDTLGSLRGGITIDLDARFILERTEKIWNNFVFVSLLATFFVVFVIYFIMNISKQKLYYLYENIALANSLKEKVTKLNKVLVASGLGYWEWNLVTGEHSVDEQWLHMLGLNRDDMKKESCDWSERIEPEDAKRIMPIIDEAIEKKNPYVVEFRMKHALGHYIWIQGSGGVTDVDENGKAIKLSGTHQDITNRKLLELEQQNNTGYLNTLFEKNPNIIIVTDGVEIVKANDAFFRFFDQYDSLNSFKQEHKCICEFFEGGDDSAFITSEPHQWVEEVFNSPEPIAKIVYKKEEYYFAVHAKKVYENGLLNIIVTFNNITDIYGLRKRFEELSIVDELTKVYNRRHFNEIFKEERNRAIREAHSFCLAIIDIDNFKLYNDTYGHDAGDNVLAAFAREANAMTKRSNEFFFRLGGEEFGVVFCLKTQEEAIDYLESIMEATRALNITHSHNPPTYKFTISIGLAYVEAGKELELTSIYKAADEALYLAKKNGRNRIEVNTL
ncbi:MAG: diguanylate cyclase [Campylobacterales bacterium]|nr:diguanylate cyclase [Campylobacterales bacterium]